MEKSFTNIFGGLTERILKEICGRISKNIVNILRNGLLPTKYV